MALATDGVSVYWGDSVIPGLEKVPVNGGNVTTLDVDAVVLSIAVDATSVYWSDFHILSILKVPTGGGSPTNLAPFENVPAGIALDSTNIYWINRNNDLVRTTPLNGGAVTTLASGQVAPMAIAVGGGTVFWLSSDGGLWSVPIGGGVPVQLAEVPLGPFGTYSLAADPFNLYVATGADVLRTSPFGGSVFNFTTSGSAFAVAVDANNVYWLDRGGKVLQFAK